MSEVEKFKCIGYMVGRSRIGGAEYVFLSDFDRVVAERDALQVLLTAADERADVLEGLLAELMGCPQVVEEATIPKMGIESAPQNVVVTLHVGLLRLRKVQAALKPAEGGSDDS